MALRLLVFFLVLHPHDGLASDFFRQQFGLICCFANASSMSVDNVSNCIDRGGDRIAVLYNFEGGVGVVQKSCNISYYNVNNNGNNHDSTEIPIVGENDVQRGGVESIVCRWPDGERTNLYDISSVFFGAARSEASGTVGLTMAGDDDDDDGDDAVLDGVVQRRLCDSSRGLWWRMVRGKLRCVKKRKQEEEVEPEEKEKKE